LTINAVPLRKIPPPVKPIRSNIADDPVCGISTDGNGKRSEKEEAETNKNHGAEADPVVIPLLAFRTNGSAWLPHQQQAQQ